MSSANIDGAEPVAFYRYKYHINQQKFIIFFRKIGTEHTGEDVYMPYDAGLSEYLKTISFKRQLLAVSKLESNINRILKKYSDYNIGDFAQ
jgi:hypothetical protein